MFNLCFLAASSSKMPKTENIQLKFHPAKRRNMVKKNIFPFSTPLKKGKIYSHKPFSMFYNFYHKQPPNTLFNMMAEVII